jgi:RNA-binding protein
MELTNKNIRYLKSLAHKYKPIVIVGNAGLTEAVINEIDSSLAHHELMKIRVNAPDRESRRSLLNEIADQANCSLVQHIGNIGLFYRPAKKPVIQLPSS